MKYHHGLSFNYPEKTDLHMIDPPQVRNEVLDKNFKYYDKGFWFVLLQKLLNVFFVIIVYFVNYVRYGLKIKGRSIKRKYRKELKNGFITVSNHVFEWDYICVRSAMRPRRGYVTVWANNHNSSLGKTMRVVGSIPIPLPESGIPAMRAFAGGINNCLKDGNMLHFYPEGSMWYYYEGLRPFKNGAFLFAVANNRPVVPLAISYRPAKGIFKLWKRKGYPCITIEIGEPVFPDETLSLSERIEKMKNESFEAIKTMQERNTPSVPQVLEECQE